MPEIVLRDYRFDTGLIIVFASAFVMLIWIILKLFRIIQTPLIFEMMPLIAGVTALIGFGAAAGRAFQVIIQTQKGLEETNKKLESVQESHIMLKADFKHFVKYRKSLG